VLILTTDLCADTYERGGKVDKYFGAYTESIPIAVPPFHGIEPKLSVAYSSAGGNGVLGVGWSLQGLSEIESIDNHLELDGQWLIGCDQQSNKYTGPDQFGSRSPSCYQAQFGQYSTLSETYLRIGSGGQSQFFVWQTNGTKTTYTGVSGKNKWLISQVTDTSGNTVTYNWSLAGSGSNFNAINSITYHGTVIQFYYEPRTLSETYAESGTFETMDKQLITIDVCVHAPNNTTPCGLGFLDADRARAYSLSYATSPQTSRPLLNNFTMFGKNALLNSAGRVTSGSATPAYTFSWNSPLVAYSTVNIGDLPDWGSDWIRQMVDFNGDGKADFCRDVEGGPNGWNLKCAISTGSGFVDEWKGQIQNWGDNQSGAWVDWDGDGKTDYCRIINRAIWCAFSTGAAGNVTAINDMQVGAPFASGDEGYAGMSWFVDWNGDGRADFCRAENHSDGFNSLRCAFSLGSASAGYTDVEEGRLYSQAYGEPSDLRGEQYSRAIVDFNGDGVMDFCRVVRDSGFNEIWCNLGSRYSASMDRNHFVGAVPTLMGTVADIGSADSQWWVDVNGDGKVDYCRLVGSGDIRCAISKENCNPSACDTNGINAFSDVLWAQLADAGRPASRRFADINGDGKADFCSSGGGTVSCQISTGFSSIASVPTGAPSEGLYEKNWMIDWAGTGRTEYCSNTGSNGGGGSELTCVRRNAGQQLDVMNSIANGIGGTTTIAYVPSSTWASCSQATNNNPPVVPTVSSVTTMDGTTFFSYCGGQYDSYTRRFLGFGWTKAVDPCLSGETACPYTETSYRLDYRWPPAPSEVDRYGGNSGALLDKTLYTYADTTLTPYRSDLMKESRFLYEDEDYTQQDISREYDAYGNLTRVNDTGILSDGNTAPQDLTGDDRALVFAYYPNDEAYIIDRPASITGLDGLLPTANVITDVRYIYDNGATWQTPPTLGHVTKTLTWLNTSNSYIGSTLGDPPYYDTTYDSYGNVISTTDALNNATSYEIDPIYHQYITKITRPAAGTPAVSQIISSSITDWDVQCGVKRRETQTSNEGLLTSYTYDQLCRKTRSDYPNGGYEKISYNYFGIPTLQQTEYAYPGPNGGDRWERSYFDGLGRTTKIMRTGPDSNSGNDLVVAEYQYNARGKLKEAVSAHYTNDPLLGAGYYPQYPNTAVYPRTFYDYDIRDRITRTTLPDNTAKTATYGLRQLTTTDEMGHSVWTYYDIRGNPTIRCSTVNNTCLFDILYYSYDTRGRLSEIQQLQQNATMWSSWNLNYDSMGRLVSFSDPNARARSYIYDNIGDRTDEIDGNGNHTHYMFDALGRRTSKTTNYVAPCISRGRIPCVPSAPPCRQGVSTPCSKLPPPVTVTWTYDTAVSGEFNVGHPTSISDPSGSATYGYDNGGNLVRGTRIVDGTAYQMQKTFDAGGYLRTTTYPDGSTAGTAAQPLGYDAAGRLTSIPGFIDNATYTPGGKLANYLASSSTSVSYDIDPIMERIRGYSVLGPNIGAIDGTMKLGQYAASETLNAQRNFETFSIQSYAVTPGQIITVATCGKSVTGASGTGRTYLRLFDPAGTEVAVGESRKECRGLSTLTYIVPAGGGGLYSVHAGCEASGACGGTVVAQVTNPTVDLARNKPATQSSNPSGAPASLAVDGNTNGNIAGNTIAITGNDPQAWWSVDLQSWYYQIDYINIWNRTDCCSDHLANFDVEVYDELSHSTTSIYVPGPVTTMTRVNIGKPGSRVTIRLRDTNSLQLAEVEVIGHDKLVLTSQAPLLYRAKLSRDAEGRISSIQSTRYANNWSYQYSPDALHQLISATNSFTPSASQSFSYDMNGNIKSGPPGIYSYSAVQGIPGPQAVQSVGSTTYHYDNNGQLVSSSAGRNFTWNGDGQLADVDGATSYTYDADGYRLKKIHNGTETIYLGDDYEIANNVQTKYITLGGQLVASQSGTASPTWLIADHQGSVLFEVDAFGNPTSGVDYQPYGTPVSAVGLDGRGFTGQRMDESGLLYLHARFADLSLGRFISPDPALPDENTVSINRYAYAEDDPINRTDIDGLGFWEDAGAWITHSAGDAAKFLQSIPDIPESVPFVGGFGIGKTLALLPYSVNAAGRGDWTAFGKSIASQAIISSAICVQIIAIYNPEILPATTQITAIAVPFALTLINTGDVKQSIANGLMGIPMYAFLKAGFLAESAPGGFGQFASSIDPWSGEALNYTVGPSFKEKAWDKFYGPSGPLGTVIANIVTANPYIVYSSRDHAVGTAPSSQLTSASGTLFGYGYQRPQPESTMLPVP
jgi:RHS repeat-associated protein